MSCALSAIQSFPYQVMCTELGSLIIIISFVDSSATTNSKRLHQKSIRSCQSPQVVDHGHHVLCRALSNVADEGLLKEGWFWIPSLAGPSTLASRASVSPPCFTATLGLHLRFLCASLGMLGLRQQKGAATASIGWLGLSSRLSCHSWHVQLGCMPDALTAHAPHEAS